MQRSQISWNYLSENGAGCADLAVNSISLIVADLRERKLGYLLRNKSDTKNGCAHFSPLTSPRGVPRERHWINDIDNAFCL